MEDQACPRCKTTKYRNPSLKLMVNVCGHTLCESCVDLLFLKGSGSCPECHIPLRRGNFRLQLFEDPMVEKEVEIRKRILRDFNKKEDDFATLREYNDYLEEIETIIYNLANNIDVMEMNKKIEQYKRENKEQILRNKAKLGRTESELQDLLEMEKQREEDRKLQLAREELELKRKKIRDKEALIDELMFSEGNAKSIVETFATNLQASKEKMKAAPAPRVTQFSSGIKFGQSASHSFIPVPVDDGPLYKYTPYKSVTEGPPVPTCQEITSKGYINYVKAETLQERAGGYKSHIACLRALHDAMGGLYDSAAKRSETTTV